MKLDWKTCFRVGVSIFCLYLAITYWEYFVGFIKLFITACTPLIIGSIIAYLVNIVMGFYEKHFFPHTKNKLLNGSRRIICLIAAIVSLLGFIYLIVQLIIPELISCVQVLSEAISIHVSNFIKYVKQNETILDYVLPDEFIDTLNTMDWQTVISKIMKILTSGITNVVDTFKTALSSVISFVITTLFSVIFAAYLLFDKDKIIRQANRLMKHYLNPSINDKIHYFTNILNKRFRGFIVGQCIEAFILGVLCIIGMNILNLPYAFMIGCFVGFTSIIPVAGAYFGGIVGAFMVFTVSPIQAIIFVIFLILLQQFEEHFIYPNVVGEAIELSGLWVLIAITIGMGMLGVVGMLIGVPLVATIYQVVKDDMERREKALEDVE